MGRDQIADQMDSPEFQDGLKQALQGLGCSVEQKKNLDQKKILPVYPEFQFLTKIPKNLESGPKF